MKKKITIILIITILLISAIAFGLYYLNTYYLPQIIKARIIKEASSKLGIILQIEDIKLNLLKGIIFYNINIINKRDLTFDLQIKRLSANFLILPFFKQKKIIFPSINIYSPTFNIIRYEDNKFNIQDFIPKQTEETKPLPSLPFLIYKINIYGAVINFLDKTMQPNFKQILKLDNLKTGISPSAVNFSLQGTIINEKQSSELELSGKFQFKTKELKILSRIDKLDISPYRDYLKDIPVNIKTLFLNNMITECILVRDTLSLKTSVEIKDAYLIKDQTSLSNAKAKLKASLGFDLKNITGSSYVIDIDELNADLTNPQIPEKTKIEYAKLEVAPHRLNIENAKIKALQTSINLKGNLENFVSPVFNIGLKSTIDLAVTKDFLKDRIDFLNSLTVSGKADIDANISKPKDQRDLEFNGSLNLKNAYLKTKDNLYEIRAINGLINFNQEKINWTNLSFGFLDKSFISNATISNLKSPRIALELASDKMNISTKVNPIQKNVFNIEYLKGKYYNSELDLSGNLSINDQNNYYADLNIHSQIELEDLKQIKNLPKALLLQINPQGECEIKGKIKGNIKNPKLLNSSLNITTNELKFYGLRLGDLKMRLVQEEKQVKIPESSCVFYGGPIYLNGLVDLEKENFPYALKITASDIDLGKLKLDTPIKDKEFQGTLSSNVILSGQANSLLDVKGQGDFLIKDGYLWEFNPLKKLGDFLFIPRHKTLVFREAKGDFSIGDKKAVTENLTLNSDIISLSCKGSIDFSGNLDFEVAPYPVSENEEAANEYKGILSGEIAKLAGISIIQVKGTIQNTKVEVKVVAKEIFDKVKEGFKGAFDKVKGITDLIFGGQE